MKTAKINPDEVDEMIYQVIELTRCYAVYWEIVKKTNFDRYSKVYAKYEDFFGTLRNALEHGFFVIAYQLFDPTLKNKSLLQIVKKLEQSDSKLAQKLELKIKELKPLLIKIYSIRCEVFAHRNQKKSPSQIFDAAKITPRQMEQIVHYSQKIVIDLAEFIGLDDRERLENDFRLRSNSSEKHTSQIMQAVEKEFFKLLSHG
jgi:AbiU2